jgi:outer membrane protein assembly factor BamB
MTGKRVGFWWTLSFASALPVLIGGQNAPGDYPQWRGQHRDGSASAFAPPSSWPTALTRRWTREIGDGYSTPLVVNDIVYAFTRQQEDEVLTALHAKTGAVIWQRSYRAPYAPIAPAAAHGPGPKATPVFYQRRIYSLGISGILSAFDAASGNLVWQSPAPLESPVYGAATSPAADEGLVLVHPGNYGPLTAFDAVSGAIRWSGAEGGVFASPLITELDGTRQVVTVTQRHVVGMSVRDGQVLWRYPWPMRATPSAITPVLYADTILVSGQGMGITAIKPRKDGDTWRVDLIWETKDASLFLSNPVLIDDTLYGLSERASGQFFALDARTGRVLWLGPPRQAANTAIVKADHLLFLLSDNAELLVARASRNGFEPLTRYTVAPSATWAQPAISGGRIFVKDTSSITLWTFE